MRRAALALLVGVLCSTASLAAAQGHAGDGAYGRLDGDLVLDFAAGGGTGFTDDAAGGVRVEGAVTADVRARYLDSAGIHAGFEWRPEGASRVLLGVDLRPLFLPRFFLGLVTGDRFWDLLIDSIGLDLGVAIAPLDETVGVALEVGFGLDVPLVFFGDGVEMLALRLHGRHVAALATDRFGPDGGIHDWLAGAALVLRAHTRLGAAGWERRRYQLP